MYLLQSEKVMYLLTKLIITAKQHRLTSACINKESTCIRRTPARK